MIYHSDSDSGDENRPRVLKVCVYGCVEPETNGHRNECLLSTEWDFARDVIEADLDTCFKLHSRMIGMEAALKGRGYNPHNN